jgi:hypothetical protein
MEGFDWGCGITVRDQAINTPLHLLCRAFRKGQGKDLFRFRTLLSDEPGNATRDHLGFSGARTSHDKEWPLAVRNGGVLLVV